jgi:class 3 adenylate cyclase
LDIGAWLRGLGLGQYEATFRESEIEADVMPDLTDQHLKDLGVSLGHRLKMLRAIRDLAAGEPLADRPAAQTEPKPPDAAERRQLTVMFCDLVGSTALSARLDPEDLGDLIRAFQGAVVRTAARFEGHVAKFMGDGALVYFGYPKAHGDDAERAARAGLGIVEAVRALRKERGAALEVRAGIATGLVVVGELMGEGEARERGVVGEPNLAETARIVCCRRDHIRSIRLQSAPRGRADNEYIPALSPSDDGARTASRLDAGAFMRYRLDEKRLPQTLFRSLPKSLESEFASLSANIDDVLEQFDARIVAAEEALAVVHAMREVEKIAIREARP